MMGAADRVPLLVGGPSTPSRFLPQQAMLPFTKTPHWRGRAGGVPQP